MLNKISAFPLMVYLALTGFARDLRDDERGLSGVVVAVLLILVAVLAVVFIWTSLSGQLTEWWDQITGHSFDPI